MKRSKLIVFKIQNKDIETVNANEVTIDDVSEIKIRLAFCHAVSFDSIDIETVDILEHELSELVVSKDGFLLMPFNVFGTLGVVSGPKASFDIDTKSGVDEMLSAISNGTIVDLISFD